MFIADDATIARMRQRWESLKHVGGSRPFLKVWIREGKLRRRMVNVDPSEVYSHIPNWNGGQTIWLGDWTPRTNYKELPNITDVQGEGGFDSNGVQSVTISMDNIGVVEHAGVAGIYHTFERGYFAPFRGYRPPGRAPVGEKNEWFDVLNDRSTEVVIVAGYGEDAAVPVFKGLVDNIGMGSRPDTISITARDMGVFLTDQHVFLNAKVRGVRDPITFADRRRAFEQEEVTGALTVSGSSEGHPASLAIDDNLSSEWWSEGHDNAVPADLPYIEMALPAGVYESFNITPAADGMECFVAVLAKDSNAPGGEGAKRNYAEKLPNDQWIDEGRGHVPGTTIPIITHIDQLKSKPKEVNFPEYGYILGDDSKLRVYFSNLPLLYANKAKRNRAAVADFSGIKQKLPSEIKAAKWILVDDVSDIVRTVLQWCGLTDWEIENTGVRLADKIVFNRGDYLIDIVKHIADLTNFVFYMKPPERFDPSNLAPGNTNNLSMGIAVFRNNQAMRAANQTLEPIETVSEDTTLQGVEPSFNNGPLAYNIRVRGKFLAKKKGGRMLGGDTSNEVMYVYNPPWSRNSSYPDGTGRGEYMNANLKQYVVHHSHLLDTQEKCKIAALFIAYREALEAYKATTEFPFMPSISLDNQMAVRDTGTGLSTRLWIVTRSWNVHLGEEANFKMAVGGSCIDAPDIVMVREELVQALRDHGYDPGLSRWELRHYGSVYANS